MSGGALGAGFSLGAAAAWGTGDYAGGMAAKGGNAFKVVAVAHATGLLICVALALLLHEAAPARGAVLWGILGGVSGGFALVAFYRSLAIGTMGINAPIAAIITATLPVILSARMEGPPQPIQIAGFVLAAISIILVSRPQKLAGPLRGIGLAVVAGVGFGIFLISMQRAGTLHVFWPLVAARATSMLLMGPIGLLAGGIGGIRGRLWLVLLAGAMDTVGNAFFMLATQHGRLDVAGALSSLYPVTTVVLARALNNEKIHPVQAVGSVLALISVPLIAA